jgi:hypothetical protein
MEIYKKFNDKRNILFGKNVLNYNLLIIRYLQKSLKNYSPSSKIIFLKLCCKFV